MTETGATGNTASSGGKPGYFNGKKNIGKQVLGKTEELGELVYKFNTKDQADMYLHTTQAVADYVCKEYGKDMRMLVKQGRERTFTKPIAPRTTADSTPGLMEKYKTELSIFHRDRKEYNDHKAKVFVVILGQCSRIVESKLENDDGFADLEKNDDVVGLLAKLKTMAFSTGGIQDPYWNSSMS